MLVPDWLNVLPVSKHPEKSLGRFGRTWMLMISPNAPESITCFTARLYGEYRSTASLA
jgi:hypothetical protein